MALTRTPKRPTSDAKPLTSSPIAALVEPYTASTGSTVTARTEEQAMMTMDSYRDIGQYWLFIEGALPGIPLALGAEALGISAYEAGEELGLKEVPRNWLQIIAHKM